MRDARAVSQAKYDQWTTWENLEHCKLTWKDLWEIEGRIGFIIIIRSTYDVLSTPQNLKQWTGGDLSCPLCKTPASLMHILTSCKINLFQRCFTWKHNQVLCKLEVSWSKGELLPMPYLPKQFASLIPPPSYQQDNSQSFQLQGGNQACWTQPDPGRCREI